MSKGHLFVVSAPSGTGKTSLVKALLTKDPTITLSISTTTRHPRIGEIHGQDYFFVKEKEFNRQKLNNEFIEWAFVYGNFYGTSARLVNDSIEQGKKVLLEIDWQGAFQIRQKYTKRQLTLIFIIPPSLDDLKERLTKRGQDTPNVVKERLSLAKKEMEKLNNFDYVIINDNFETAVNELYKIVSRNV